MRFKLGGIILMAALAGVPWGCSRELPQEKRAVHDLRVPVETVRSWLDKGHDVLFVDMRSEDDWNASSKQLPGAVRVQSYQGVETLMQTVKRDRFILAYGTQPDEGPSAGLALMLRDNGFKYAYALLGGWDAWVKAGYPVAGKSSPQ